MGVAVLDTGVAYDVTLGCGRGWMSTAGCSEPYLELVAALSTGALNIHITVIFTELCALRTGVLNNYIIVIFTDPYQKVVYFEFILLSILK